MYTKKENVREVTVSLDLIFERFGYEVKYLKEYLAFSKESVSERVEKISDQIFEDTQQNPELESMLQDMYEYESRAVSSYLYHSSIVLVYTVLESTLAQICTELKFTARIAFPYDKISGAGNVMKQLDYLEMMASFPLTEINRIKPSLGKYQKLRNAIAHHNGRFHGKDEAAKESQKTNFLRDFDDIELSPDGKQFYIMSSTAVEKLIQLVVEAIENIVSHIRSQTFIVPV